MKDVHEQNEIPVEIIPITKKKVGLPVDPHNKIRLVGIKRHFKKQIADAKRAAELRDAFEEDGVHIVAPQLIGVVRKKRS